MKTFKFEILVMSEREIRFVKSNHLQGTIRKLYQEEKHPFELKKIL